MQENIFRSAIKSGLILGALFSLRFILGVVGEGWIIGLLRILLIVGIVAAMWKLSEQYRNNENEGFISFGKAFGFTVLSFLYASLISAVVKIVYFVINPDFLGDLVNEMLLAFDQAGMATAETERVLEVMLSPVFWSFFVILGNMILGVIVGLIVAAIVQKEKGVFEE